MLGKDGAEVSDVHRGLVVADKYGWMRVEVLPSFDNEACSDEGAGQQVERASNVVIYVESLISWQGQDGQQDRDDDAQKGAEAHRADIEDGIEVEASLA